MTLIFKLIIIQEIIALIYSYITVHIFEKDSIAEDNRGLLLILVLFYSIPIVGIFFIIPGLFFEIKNLRRNKYISRLENNFKNIER